MLESKLVWFLINTFREVLQRGFNNTVISFPYINCNEIRRVHRNVD